MEVRFILKFVKPLAEVRNGSSLLLSTVINESIPVNEVQVADKQLSCCWTVKVNGPSESLGVQIRVKFLNRIATEGVVGHV